MVSRKERRRRKSARRYKERLFERHRRHNMVYGKPGLFDFVLILDNLKPYFNIGKIFRSADALGAREIHLVGTETFDAKAAKGAFKWVPAVFHQQFDSCYERLSRQDYTFFILEPSGDGLLHETHLPQRSAFILGHEEFGISFERSHYPEMLGIKIQQVGRVQSLNVSVAASILMFEYFRQHYS